MSASAAPGPVLELVWVPRCGGVSVGNLERRDDRRNPGVLVLGSVAPGADRPAAREDRHLNVDCGGCDGGVLLPVVVWCRV